MMKNKRLCLAIIFCSVCFSLDYVPDQIIVKYKSSGLPVESHAVGASSNRSITEQILKDIPFKIKTEREMFPKKALANVASMMGTEENPMDHIYHLILEPSSDVASAVDYLRQQPQIEYAEPNYVAHALDVIPNDHYYAASPNLKSIY
ncbi:MAG: hypothetical protein AABZ14_08515, partial [Candidatus Margulisiibacteriota bacterium]